jgi:nitroreductase
MTQAGMLEFLTKRRSVMARNMTTPGPSADVLRAMLEVAMRVPDHGKIAPWKFIILEGEDRDALGAVAAQALGDEDSATKQAAAAQFARAPVVVAVLATPKAHPKVPRSEQILSAGAACMNLLIAAQSQGFAAQWLTGKVAYAPEVKAALGGGADDEIAAFIYIGTAVEAPSERGRPAYEDVVQIGLAQR